MGNQQSGEQQQQQFHNIQQQQQISKKNKLGCRQDGQNTVGCYGCMSNNNANLENCLDPNELNLDYENFKPRGRLTNKSVQYLTPNEISFFQCSAGRNVSKIRYYIKQGVNINIVDEERTSPLHVAARHGSYQLIQELLINGANVDITDLAGWTPLHVAVFFQRAQVAELLLKNGSNRYIKNRDNQTAYDLIKDQKSLDVFNNYEDKIIETTNRLTNTTQLEIEQHLQQHYQNQYSMLYNQNNNYEFNNGVQNESTALEPQLQSPRKHQYYMYFKNLKHKLTYDKSQFQSNSQQQQQQQQSVSQQKQNQHQQYQINKFHDECDEHTIEEIEMENRRNQFNNPSKKKFMKDYNNLYQIQQIRKFESMQKINPNKNRVFNKVGDEVLASEPSGSKKQQQQQQLCKEYDVMDMHDIIENENLDPNTNYHSINQINTTVYNGINSNNFNNKNFINNMEKIQQFSQQHHQQILQNRGLHSKRSSQNGLSIQLVNQQSNGYQQSQYNSNYHTPTKQQIQSPQHQFMLSPVEKSIQNSPCQANTIGSIFFLNKKVISLHNLIFQSKYMIYSLQLQNYESKQYYMNDANNNIEEYKHNSVKDLNNYQNKNNNNNLQYQNQNQNQQQQQQQQQQNMGSGGDLNYFEKIPKLLSLILTLVNIDYICGIALLQLFKFSKQNSLKNLIEVLTKNSTVSKSTLGFILTDNTVKEHSQFLNYFLQRFDFSLIDFNKALKEFFVSLEVINDPEKIDILLQAFSQVYFKNNYKNKQYFESVDSVHMLAFATIMLDIEVHTSNKDVVIKDVLSQFEQNIYGINDDQNLDKQFVIDIIDNVLQKQQIVYLVSQDQILKKQIQQFQTFLTILENISDSQCKVAKIGNSKKVEKNMIMYLVENYIILLYQSFETSNRWLRIFNTQSVSGSYKNGLLKISKFNSGSNNKIDYIRVAKVLNGQGVLIQQKEQLVFEIQANIQNGQKIIDLFATKQKK